MLILFSLACSSSYIAGPDALDALLSGELTTVTIESDWIVFEPTNNSSDIGVAFYPGGKVEAEAYAPILRQLSDAGITTYLLSLPADLAILDQNAVLDVFDIDPREQWIVSGHSLGGVAAAKMAGQESNIVGLSLWASYPASSVDLSNSNLVVQSLIGSNDGVVNWENWNDSSNQLPSSTSWMTIEGGNHSQFGDYGLQTDDGIAAITAEEQWTATSSAILALIESLP